MIDNIKINLATLYEFLDSTKLLGRGADILAILEAISDNNGKLNYNGVNWDFTK